MLPQPETADTATAAADATRVLSRHGKSFYWAGRFLSTATLEDAATLYAFCRLVDDSVDEAETTEQAKAAIASLRASLTAASPQDRVVAAFTALASRRGIDQRFPSALIDGVESDLGAVTIPTRHDLLRYCYRVAGSVGAMMCPILGARDGRALPFAIDLGIGMQLTNIARDVLEDAHRQRLYLPTEEFNAPVTVEGLLEGNPNQRQAATQVVLRLLDLAEEYYRSAAQGLRFIPLRQRLAVLVAARIYRAIGLRIISDPMRIWTGRTIVSRGEKVMRSGAALIEMVLSPSLLAFGPPSLHRRELHTPLAGLLPS